MSEALTAEVDAWAEAQGMARADAIRRLVEISLIAGRKSVFADATGSIELVDLAIKQISEMLDPSLPFDERERRIRRLVEGPPEFSAERIDLPKPRK